MEHATTKGKIYKPVLIVITAALLAEIVCGIFFTNQFGAAMSNMLYWVGDNFGWWINLLAVFCVIVGIVIVIFRWGDVKIGGKDAKPGPFAAASAAVLCSGQWVSRCITL